MRLKKAPWLGSLALAVASGPVWPLQTAEAATAVHHQHFHRTSVGGFTYSDDGCLSTDRYFVSDQNGTFYQSRSYNRCTDEGALLFGEAPSTTFKVKGHLATARLVATIPLTDAYTGKVVGDITIDETFSATAPAETGNYGDYTRMPGEFLFMSRLSNTYRDARATGTLAVDDAYIGTVRSGTVAVSHSAS